MQLIPLDVNNKEHIDITYEILLQRFKNDHINIYDIQVPTVEQHVATLSGDTFKHFYFIEHDNMLLGYIYIKNKDNEYGYFVNYKKAARVYKSNRHTFSEEDTAGHSGAMKMWIFYAEISLRLLLERHPEIKKITAKINSNNRKSMLCAEHGVNFKPIYTYYEFNR